MTDEKTGRRRVLLKLSGEAFGAGTLGVNPDVIGAIAKEIATAAQDVELAIKADEVLVAKNGVDGVYTADPKKDATAEKLHHVTYQDALLKGLKVVDATAFSLCMDNGMPMHVFGMEGDG
ncbi:hypothetical protein IAE22_31445, partial [Bacillus sp. S34]|nr:hypothetical protein [Bacillus sp. S34]